MIRFVIRRKMMYRGTGLQTENLETMDCAAPELERVLQGGGHDEHGSYDYREVIGAEMRPDSQVDENGNFDRVPETLDAACIGWKAWCERRGMSGLAEHIERMRVALQDA